MDKAHWEPAHRVRRQLWDMGAGESSDRAVGPGYRAGVDRQPIERRWLASGATALKPATLQAVKVPDIALGVR